ncbi:hypothetical protein BIV57_09590 [Mangrovactinospora gilvigrisea]|uniref:HTH gntR-type domain-containing protein n=1 Tax=Mangrovactinospora gilvigrisea TaxID=1428644 RepID=A0A1J7BGV9_9ACTN|nr:winged helix-turn-helix domain-containing protein [Mangrovactinospora gilvigrisea]OIV37805.1 hypothetical protein BIV57_09590 [Mangrovactinospora gilvigrisea]
MSLDGGNGGPTAKPEWVAGELRDAIDAGRYHAGEKLPSQGDLAGEFEVSRPTVQLALKILENDGVIDPMQRGRRAVVAGDRAQVSEGGIFLADAVETAFGEQQDVTIDYFGFTAETLNSAMQLPIRRMRIGALQPKSVTLRLMLPSDGAHLALPRSVTDPDDARPRQRMDGIRRNQVGVLRTQFAQMQKLAVPRTELRFELRTVPLTPTFKLYVLNRRAVFSGLYQVQKWVTPLDGGAEVEAYDVAGFNLDLRRHTGTYAEELKAWFESYWDTIAAPA